MEEARRINDIEERATLIGDSRLFLEDLPSIPLYVPLLHLLRHRPGRGRRPRACSFTPASRFRNVVEWTLEGSPASAAERTINSEQMSFRELLMILSSRLLASVFVWFETGTGPSHAYSRRDHAGHPRRSGAIAVVARSRLPSAAG